VSTSHPDERPDDRARSAGIDAAPPLDPTHPYRGGIRPGVSRRTLLLSGAAAIMAGVAAGSATGTASATAATAAARGNLTRSIEDVKHVVILMQENRSFDHYYGTFPGVRGFSDKQAVEYPGGGSVFAQPDATRTDGGHLLPFPLDSANHNAQGAGSLNHSWKGGHAAWNKGAWDNWVVAKTQQTMGYFTKEDVPFHHALASAFTIADHYHCSLIGPTTPNRLYQWTGTIDPEGTAGGPIISNPEPYEPVFRWTTYQERLHQAGVTWKTYANDEVGDPDTAPYVGDYGCNPLWQFQQYHDAFASTDPAVRQLALDGGLHDGWKPDSGRGLDVSYLLRDFGADAAANTLPQVSYVVSPYGWSEHPEASPDYGAHYTNAVIHALMSNPDTWASTVLLLNYDENDGYFDHLLPPLAEPGTADEYVGGLPIGYGTRVPLTVVSPWSRGGWVDSQVFDHTSIIRFLETWTGVHEPNISDWRRTISGDLTSCFDFAHPDFSIPTADQVLPLSETRMLLAAADADLAKPPVQEPAAGAQMMPSQDPGTMSRRPLPYRQDADVTVDRGTGAITLTMRNRGSQGVSHQVFPNIALPFASTPFTLAPDGSATYAWDSTAHAGAYDFSVYGPDRFLRRFAGTVIPATTSDVPVPVATAEAVADGKPHLRLTLGNEGSPSVDYTLTSNDFLERVRHETVKPGRSTTVKWPLDRWGYYDVVVEAPGGFRHRFAGRVE